MPNLKYLGTKSPDGTQGIAKVELKTGNGGTLKELVGCAIHISEKDKSLRNILKVEDKKYMEVKYFIFVPWFPSCRPTEMNDNSTSIEVSLHRYKKEDEITLPVNENTSIKEIFKKYDSDNYLVIPCPESRKFQRSSISILKKWSSELLLHNNSSQIPKSSNLYGFKKETIREKTVFKYCKFNKELAKLEEPGALLIRPSIYESYVIGCYKKENRSFEKFCFLLKGLERISLPPQTPAGGTDGPGGAPPPQPPAAGTDGPGGAPPPQPPAAGTDRSDGSPPPQPLPAGGTDGPGGAPPPQPPAASTDGSHGTSPPQPPAGRGTDGPDGALPPQPPAGGTDGPDGAPPPQPTVGDTYGSDGTPQTQPPAAATSGPDGARQTQPPPAETLLPNKKARPHPAMEEPELRRLLYSIGSEIGDRDLQNMKYLCRDKVEEGQLQRAETAIDVFKLLLTRDIIRPSNLDFLEDILEKGGRKDLVSRIRSSGGEVASEGLLSSSYSTPSSFQDKGKYRVFLNQLCGKLTKHDIESLKFLIIVPGGQEQDMKSGHQLMDYLERTGKISQSNLNYLIEIFNVILRIDLSKEVIEATKRESGMT